MTDHGATNDVQATLCQNGCGFFGNPGTANMCSVCYKSTHMNKPQEQPAPSVLVPSPEPMAKRVDPAPSPAIASTSEQTIVGPDKEESAPAVGQDPNAPENNDPTPPTQANKNRCYSCNKKIGLTGFECRCGFVYCATHRHANKHECVFDFRQMGRDAVAKANPLVNADKVEKV